MVAIKIRMKHLIGKLATVRCGMGAAVMSPEVKRLVLDFPFKSKNGSMGPRKFWRLYMPSLKYHNPNIQMEVARRKNLDAPSTLTIEFENNRKEVLDIKDKDRVDIFTTVLELTKATPVPTSEEDAMILQKYEELKKREMRKVTNRVAKIAAQKQAARMGITATSPLVS